MGKSNELKMRRSGDRTYSGLDIEYYIYERQNVARKPALATTRRQPCPNFMSVTG
jgi:hypothetical protein